MQSQPVSRRARPFLGIVLLLALPVAAWSAMSVQASPRRATAEAASVPALPAEHQSGREFRLVRPPDPKIMKWKRAVERAQAEQRLRDVATFLQAVEAHKQRVATWDTLAQCETQQNWNLVGRYGGGLGIYIGAWTEFGGREFASNPGYATKEQQITVAERIYARFGFTGWGCAHTLGWVG
jgi:hypothetical protein